MFKYIKRLLGLKVNPVMTIHEKIDLINSKYHFTDFNESFVDEVYTILSENTEVKITRESEYVFDIFVDGNVFTLTENGIKQNG